MVNGKFYYVVLVALMLFFAIYTSLKFPYTYMTLEGDDFWVLTRDYWQQKLATPPALTNWLSEYLLQFYRSPYVAAGIEALVLGAIGLLAHRTLSIFPIKKSPFKGDLEGLCLLPPILLGFCCTFCLSFHLQCLFFFAFLYGYMLIPGYKWKFLASILMVPFGFMLMKTPMLFLLLLAQLALTYIYYKKSSPRKVGVRGGLGVCLWLLPLILLALTPLVYSQQVAFIPFGKRYTHWDGYFDPLTSKYCKDGEYIRKMVILSNEQRWEDLLYRENIRRDAQRGNATALRYALLAESALGTLPDNLLDYPINDENLFLYPHQREYVTLQLNRLFYLNLGIYDEAFHQAQEYGLLMLNGDCFSSRRQMADYSIEEGEWEIADKFLHILSKSSCHKDFVRERRALIPNPYSLIPNPNPLRADNFVGGFPLPIEMLRLARYYEDSPNRKKMVDYALCSYLLRGDVNRFMIVLQSFDYYKDKELPRAYRQFLESAKPTLP